MRRLFNRKFQATFARSTGAICNRLSCRKKKQYLIPFGKRIMDGSMRHKNPHSKQTEIFSAKAHSQSRMGIFFRKMIRKPALFTVKCIFAVFIPLTATFVCTMNQVAKAQDNEMKTLMNGEMTYLFGGYYEAQISEKIYVMKLTRITRDVPSFQFYVNGMTKCYNMRIFAEDSKNRMITSAQNINNQILTGPDYRRVYSLEDFRRILNYINRNGFITNYDIGIATPGAMMGQFDQHLVFILKTGENVVIGLGGDPNPEYTGGEKVGGVLSLGELGAYSKSFIFDAALTAEVCEKRREYYESTWYKIKEWIHDMSGVIIFGGLALGYIIFLFKDNGGGNRGPDDHAKFLNTNAKLGGDGSAWRG